MAGDYSAPLPQVGPRGELNFAMSDSFGLLRLKRAQTASPAHLPPLRVLSQEQEGLRASQTCCLGASAASRRPHRAPWTLHWPLRPPWPASLEQAGPPSSQQGLTARVRSPQQPPPRPPLPLKGCAGSWTSSCPSATSCQASGGAAAGSERCRCVMQARPPAGAHPHALCWGAGGPLFRLRACHCCFAAWCQGRLCKDPTAVMLQCLAAI
jgi:hypothetical protein